MRRFGKTNKGQSNLANGDIARLYHSPGSSTRREVGHGVTFGAPYWGKGDRRELAMVRFERAMVVSYKLSIATFTLSLTIRPPFAIECFLRLNQQR